MAVDDLLVQQPVVGSADDINSIFTIYIDSKRVEVEWLFQHILLRLHEGLHFLRCSVLILDLLEFYDMFTKLNLIRL